MKKQLLLIFLLVTAILFAQNPVGSVGRFYGLGNGSNGRAIYAMTKNASSITYDGVYVTGVPSTYSLAIADLGDGNRFYSNTYDFVNNSGSILKYNGSSWETVTDGVPIFYNASGYRNYLYFHSTRLNNTTENRISRFDGAELTTLWEDQSVYSPVADIAIDDLGNVYFFTGPTPYDVDTLNIMSPSGVMLQQLTINFEGLCGYGMNFVDDKLYLTFCDANSTFPNKMVSLDLSATEASFGASLTVPQPVVGTTTNGQILLAMIDIASCTSAKSLLGNEGFTEQEGFEIFTTGEQLLVHSIISADLTILNLSGETLYQSRLSGNSEESIDLSAFSSGLYFIKAISNNQIIIRKFIKS
ncbi:T9SS type A sorting domain-containing protein [Flavobacterium sp. CYK-4]|uniref:T9SS type A sorting domain-containing protein n=1 Tax=Flavobacterium lotistagni TaxID=2709660 RepID=UPI00140755E1|nr:T9SS type A sorting domain-containing protein [Flavobacterium lotistagni]NHM07280.1 T9SS type A sorting domain-containing protein [Flavobacterium lotistagni]